MELIVTGTVSLVALALLGYFVLRAMRILHETFSVTVTEQRVQIAQLENKLMSRSYGEYAAGQRLQNSPPKPPVVEGDEDEDEDEAAEWRPTFVPPTVSRPQEGQSNAGQEQSTVGMVG